MPWHTNSILIINENPPKKPYSAPICRSLPSLLAISHKKGITAFSVKPGKMRQIRALCSSQKVVKIEKTDYSLFLI